MHEQVTSAGDLLLTLPWRVLSDYSGHRYEWERLVYCQQLLQRSDAMIDHKK